MERLTTVNKELKVQCRYASQNYLSVVQKKESGKYYKYQKKAEEDHLIQINRIKRSIEQLKVSNPRRNVQSFFINIYIDWSGTSFRISVFPEKNL